MSKIGKLPILIKEEVTLSIQDKDVVVTGPKGTLSFKIPEGIDVQVVDGKIVVDQKEKENTALRNLYGLTRARIANMVNGVLQGFEKKLELSGVGYRAQVSGNELVLSVGFTHPVKITAPEGITFSVSENVITVMGINKDQVGNIAARIRAVRPPEPYKGKGISYMGEKIRRKAGKTAKTVGAVTK